MSTLVICPSCGGDGIVSRVVRHTCRCEWEAGNCSLCAGEGRIAADRAAIVAAGATAYYARVKRGISLRDRAAELGVTARELGDFEHGRFSEVPDWVVKAGSSGNLPDEPA